MGIYIESLILYIVLFLTGSAGAVTGIAPQTAGFSASSELARAFLYSIPSLALIWYLLLKVKRIRDWDILPGKKDLISGLIAFPCLLITGSAAAFISSYIGGAPAHVPIYSPSSPMEWVILCFSLLCAAYLEESFFRFYLLARRDEFKLSAASALIVSTMLFSICHIYEGPWGFLNACMAAVILAFVFLRYHALHGIAIAHGLYNIAVYAVNAALAKS